jgi:hypothetical protein
MRPQPIEVPALSPMRAAPLHNFAADRSHLPNGAAMARSRRSQRHENTWLLVAKKFIEPALAMK